MVQFLPRLSIIEWGGMCLSGHGARLEVFPIGSCRSNEGVSIRVFHSDSSHIYGILPSTDGLFVFGERRATYIHRRELSGSCIIPPSRVRNFPDAVLEGRVLSGEQIALLFTCNTIVLYNYSVGSNSFEIEEDVRVQSTHTAVLLKALLVGQSWNELLTIVGTVFGDILVSRPSTGSSILWRFRGHTGMIFGLMLSGDRLFSISDDRSLRVWNAVGITDIKDGEVIRDITELSCVFGHCARPFAICQDGGGALYTGGVDQIICKWHFDGSSLILLAKKPVNNGAIRSLYCKENNLYVGSETGGIICVDISTIGDIKTPVLVETCLGLRGFARSGNDLYTVDYKGHVYLNGSMISNPSVTLRYLVSSHDNGNNDLPVVLAYGDRDVAIYCGGKCLSGLLSHPTRILSALSSDKHVFVYTFEKIGILYTIFGEKVKVFHAGPSLLLVNKTKPLFPSCIDMHRLGGRNVIIIGSTSGHLLYASYDDGEKDVELVMNGEINSYFGGDSIMQVSLTDKLLMTLGKNGKIINFKVVVDNNILSFKYHSYRTATNALHGFWPCKFVDKCNYIAGFHASSFHLVRFPIGEVMVSIDCGGGNRPWNFVIRHELEGNSYGLLEFIKNENLLSVSVPLLQVRTISPVLHRGQILFVKTLNLQENDTIVVTGSVDHDMVFSQYNLVDSSWNEVLRLPETNGYTCIDVESNTSEFKIVTGGEKGSLAMRLGKWKDLLAGVFVSIDVDFFTHPSKTRIIDLKFIKESFRDDHLRFVAACANGTIDLLSYSGIICKSNMGFQLLANIAAPDNSMFTKIFGWKVEDATYLCSVSTSGKLNHWKFDENTTQLVKINEIRADNCGLSSMSVLTSFNGLRYVTIGSESGKIIILKIRPDIWEIKTLAVICYHAATVTDIYLTLAQNVLKIRSVSLDCRLAEHDLCVENGLCSFIRSTPLGVWDPTAIDIVRNNVIVTGSGLEIIKC